MHELADRLTVDSDEQGEQTGGIDRTQCSFFAAVGFRNRLWLG
jgi:hypothetical protein